ncbi:MAG: DUF1569 domain-containing protein [Planctomycetaceae bacterium]
MTMPTRRPLQFHDLDDAVRDAESLLASGYDRAGNWDLAQTCGHLAEWMRFPLEGFPRGPLPVRMILWFVGITFARRKLRKTLASNAMPAGGPTLRETVPPPGGDEAAAVGRLRQTVERFKAYDGPLHPSPLFGDLDRETASRMQLLHCAHHLGFLVPRRGVEREARKEQASRPDVGGA